MTQLYYNESIDIKYQLAQNETKEKKTLYVTTTMEGGEVYC
jgi:hypothetical protein